MKLIPDSTTINSADSNMSVSLDSCVLLIQECSDRKQLRFSKNNTDLSQPNHFPVHKVWHWPTLCQVGTYIPVGSYIRFQDLSGRYLNSSRFFNSGLRSIVSLSHNELAIFLLLHLLNHIHIWQVSPQLSCVNNCQMKYECNIKHGNSALIMLNNGKEYKLIE